MADLLDRDTGSLVAIVVKLKQVEQLCKINGFEFKWLIAMGIDDAIGGYVGDLKYMDYYNPIRNGLEVNQ
jgi:hypothetical protein